MPALFIYLFSFTPCRRDMLHYIREALIIAYYYTFKASRPGQYDDRFLSLLLKFFCQPHDSHAHFSM